MARKRWVGRELEVLIKTLDFAGMGCATLDTRDVRVRNALPGEKVTARVLKRKRGQLFSDAVAHEAREESTIRRVRSACPYFPRCGGCAYHHVEYAAQLLHKQRYLAQALQDSSVEPHQWRAPVSTGRLGYRTKARLGVRKVGDRVLVGFRESFSTRVADIKGCLALTPELSALIVPLRDLLGTLSVAHAIPQIEVAQGGSEIVLIVRHLEAFTRQDLARLSQFSRTQRVVVALQSKGYETLQLVDGASVPTLRYVLPDYGLTVAFGAEQFTQVNVAMNQELVRTVLAYFGHDLQGRRILDLFCGIGNFALPLARRGAQVKGYEFAQDAVRRAQENARHNEVANSTQFAAMDLYGDQVLEHGDGVDALLLDPPRSGAGPNLAAWLQFPGLGQIVYVSCNPTTFASDARIICDQGFVLEEVGVYDMFPQTAHVETVGNFVRRH